MYVEIARLAPTASVSARRSPTRAAVAAARDRIQRSRTVPPGRLGAGPPVRSPPPGTHDPRRAYVTKNE